MSTSLLSGIIRCLRLILCFPCPGLDPTSYSNEVKYLETKTWVLKFFSWKMHRIQRKLEVINHLFKLTHLPASAKIFPRRHWELRSCKERTSERRRPLKVKVFGLWMEVAWYRKTGSEVVPKTRWDYAQILPREWLESLRK